GPIAEVLLFVPLWGYSLLARAIPVRQIRVRHYLLFFAIVIGISLPWYVAIYLREPEFLKHFFWEHNVLRFLQPFDHLQPVWYYAPILLVGMLPGTLLFVPYFRNLFGERAERAGPSLAGGFWLIAGGWCVFFFSCSGSKLPTYILPAYPFLCLALGEFIARGAASRLTFGIGGMAAVIIVVHAFGVPWYAEERSPFGRPELVEKYVDVNETVVCFPRNCDSLAFYSNRSDFQQVSTRDVNQLYVDCHHRPRTVILFTHADSLQGFKNALPPSLRIVEETSLKRKYGSRLLNKVFGSTPWGLCDIAVVAPR
ncbi:MAG TPA: dolichol-phosphate mannosyltransferase, partial [Gemmataceae bacterium]